MKLYCPPSYRQAQPEERNRVCNGCGSKGSSIDLIPDSMYGLDVSEACNIHDWMYSEGKTIEDKEKADRVFLNNILRIINGSEGWPVTKWLRRRRAWKYYLAVKMFGGDAFWDGKNDPENLIPIKKEKV